MSGKIETGGVSSIPVLQSEKPGKQTLGIGSYAAQSRQSSTDASAAGTSTNNTVYLSERAQSLRQLTAELAAVPAVDSARVAAAREAITSGSYTADPDKIAAGFMLMGGLR